MTIVADQYRFVTGIDTHSRKHHYAIIAADGRLIAEAAFPATPAGISRAIAWTDRRTASEPMLASIDGASSYGAPLTRAFLAQNTRVVEAPRAGHRPAGKTDRLDARAAATMVLPMDTTRLADVKSGPERDALQILLTARDQLARDKTRSQNALIGLARRHDLGIDARRAFTLTQTRTISRWRERTGEDIATATARDEAIRLATHILALRDTLATNSKRIHELVATVAPQLLDEPGIGPVTAATIYTAWSHPGRVRSEAAFARIAGTAPIPASSGQTTRHRLDKGGNRRLNAAIHRVIITRWRNHPDTLAYRDRRRAQGRTDRDIRRALKRHLTRHLYRLLQAGTPTPETT